MSNAVASPPAPVDPPSSAPPRSRRRGLVLLAAMVWIALSMLLELGRSIRVPVWDGIWAEDARYFYSNARDHPWHSTLFQPLAGYLQVVPRFWSIVAAQFPVADAALLISSSAAFSAALLSVYVFVASRGVLPQLWQRCAVAVIVVVHPAASYEVNAALNNIHWFLIIAAFWACLSEATGRWRTAADVLVVALSTLSDPLTVLWLPIAAVRAWRRQGSARWVTGAMVAALVLQYALAVHAASAQHQNKDYGGIPEVYAFRIAGSALVGEAANRDLWNAHGASWALLAVVVAAALVVTGLLLRRGRTRVLIAVAVGYSIVFLVVPLVFRGLTGDFLVAPAKLVGSRYVIVPLFLAYTAIIAAGGQGAGVPNVGSEPAPSARRMPRWASGVVLPVLVCGLIGVHIVANYATLGARTASASWRQAVSSAQVACAQGQIGRRVPSALPKRAQPYLRAPGVVWLPVAPWTDNWSARIQCNQL